MVKEYLLLFLQLFYTLNIISKSKVTKKFKRDKKENRHCRKEYERSEHVNKDTIP